MATVVRLLTRVDVRECGVAGASLRATHEAVLDSGTRVLLLDDRGWGGGWPDRSVPFETLEEMEFTARAVVGPDEPFGGRTDFEIAAGHWATLAATLRAAHVDIDPDVLRALPHDVELSVRAHALTRGR
jgi:hypothetical protein